MLLPGGDILRVAQDSETIWSIYDAALPAIILSCILMMGAAALIAGLLTRSLVQPILKMTDDLEHIQENVPYRELIPFAESIHSELDKQYPQYQLAKHKGYPTKLHYELIEQYGIQPFYRRSFLKKQGYWPEGK